ncbi:putative diguanylate cyclase [Magnetofaba australis IT-1]|uniref:diguanylate cyclase n=1 Tax=Magnetofaba australis IT-1 TaxID=1434232 RepID=A0A1Y2JYY9_9PROT|nr:putative diguanylate cyclase [Magnetofaba australis IT-1]
MDLSQPWDGRYLIGHAWYLRDDSAHLTAEQARDLPLSDWRPLTLESLEQGMQSAPYWLRFAVVNPSKQPVGFVIEDEAPYRGYLALHVWVDGQWRSDIADRALPFSARSLKFPSSAAAATLPPVSKALALARLDHDFPQPNSLVQRLWSRAAFDAYAPRYLFSKSLMLGFLAAVAMVWMVFALLVRQRRLYYYAGYLSFLLMAWFQVLGFTGQFIAPEAPWLQAMTFHGPLFFATACAFGFARLHLDLPAHMRRMNRVFQAMTALFTAAGAFHLLNISRETEVLLTLLGFVALTLLFFVGAAIWRRTGKRYALWFTLAWGVIGLFLMLNLLMMFAGIEVGRWLISSIIDLIFLALLVEVFFLTISVAEWLRTEVRRRVEAEEEASRDPLTGLLNRRGFERLATLRLARQGGDVWLAALDADHFKAVNDTYGHPGGDAVLVHLAQIIQAHCRRDDLVCRMGGEEFAIVFHGANPDDAFRFVERLRRAFADTPTLFENRVIAHTLSIGLARWAAQGDIDQLIQQADRALYAAKEQGRNRVVMVETGNAAAGAPARA